MHFLGGFHALYYGAAVARLLDAAPTRGTGRDVRDMLVEIAELVQDEEIGATSTALDEYSKCKIYKNAKGVLFITRTDTSTRQESV